MTLPIDSRLNPVHKNLIENVRFGQVWGHLPPEEGLFDFFLNIKKYTKVEHILEFGTCLGFSSSYQLTLFPEANLVTYDDHEWVCDQALYGKNREINIDFPAWMLCKLTYGDRFRFRQTSSRNACVHEKPNHFDYCFIDGDHTFDGTVFDIETARKLGIKYFVVDNLQPGQQYDPALKSVLNAVKSFGNEIRELERYTYTSEYPLLKDGEKHYIYDDIVLFEFDNL